MPIAGLLVGADTGLAWRRLVAYKFPGETLNRDAPEILDVQYVDDEEALLVLFDLLPLV